MLEESDDQVVAQAGQPDLVNKTAEEPTDDALEQEQASGTDEASPDELMREIRRLRREAAKWRTQLRKLEQEKSTPTDVEEAAPAQEVQELQSQLSKVTAQLERERQERARENLHSRVVGLAARADGERPQMHDPQDAIRHLDLAEWVNSEDLVSLANDALIELYQEKPYLFAQPGTHLPQAAPRVRPTNPAAGQQVLTDKERFQRLYDPGNNQFWQGGGVIMNE